MFREKIVPSVAIIALVIGVFALSRSYGVRTAEKKGIELGAQAGTLMIENYIPYVLYNGGIRTALGINASSTLDVSGTTTPFQFLEPVGGTFSTSATGTAQTVYNNTTGPKLCYGIGGGGLLVKNNGTFSPSVVFSVGTSTGSVTTTNLLASSTIATSTSGSTFAFTRGFLGGVFRLDGGDSIMAIMGDITNTEASSTYFGNLSAEVRILCTEETI